MDHDLFIQSQNGTFGCFHLGVILPSGQFLIMDNAVYKNICIHICGHMFSFPLDKYLIGELLNFMVSICLTLKKKKKCQIVFQSGRTILPSHQKSMGVPFAPHVQPF